MPDLLGKTAGEIIRDRVLLEAKRLLTNASLTVTEAAHNLNFQDNSYFNRFFKKYTGATPDEFRNNFLIENDPIMDNLNMPVMANTSGESHPSVLNVFKCKCPLPHRQHVCRSQSLQTEKKTMKMHQTCTGVRPAIRPGGWILLYGSSYVSYGLSIAISVATLVAWWVLIGFSTQDNRFFYWMAVNGIILIGLQPILMRLARSIWIAFFVRFDPNWKNIAPEQPERINKDHMNAW